MTHDWEYWTGRTIDGKYPLHRCLGGRADSAAFLTESGAQKAVIKLVAAGKTEADAWVAQWRRTSVLTHPNLLRVYDEGTCRVDDDTFAYLVTEFAGENLGEVIPERALTAEEAKETFRPALKALAFLHANGFVHGGLKPSNLLAIGDQLKLAASTVSRIGAKAAPGRCDAPELAETGGTPATDAWSIGVTIVEVLTQQLPDTSSDAVSLPDLPAPFSEIARGCLRRDPQHRFTIAQASAVLEGKPAARLVHRGGKLVQKIRTGLILGGVVVLAGIIIRNRMTPDSETTPPAPVETAKPAEEKPESKAESKKGAAKERKSTPPVDTKQEAAKREQARLGETRRESVRREEEKRRQEEAARQSEAQQREARQKEANQREAKQREAKPAEPKPSDTGAVRVSAGSGDVVQQVVPEGDSQARRTIRGRVIINVRVRVAPSGEVQEATLDSRGSSKYFSRLAVDAARKWKFAPASGDAPRDYLLQFKFLRQEASAVSQRVSAKP